MHDIPLDFKELIEVFKQGVTGVGWPIALPPR